MTPLEIGQLRVIRIRALVIALVLFAAAAVAESVLREQIGLMRGTITGPILLPLLWLVLIAPKKRYLAWGYSFTGEALRLRYGRWTQVETLVPLDRVQHIDIAQGPIERANKVCRLVVHTAGTAHSQVVLPGLSRDSAEAMRDAIRARIREEEG